MIIEKASSLMNFIVGILEKMINCEINIISIEYI